MKKMLSSVVALLVVVCLAAGCAGGSNKSSAAIGNWTAESITTDGETIQYADYLKLLGDAADQYQIKLSLTDDGKFNLSMMEQSFDGTWTEKDNKLTMKSEGETIEAELQDDKLVLSQGSDIITFVKA